jgi:hypothetical protein
MLCFVLLLVGGGGGILVHPSTASATTGPTNPPPALYKVPQSIAMQFPGQYAIQTVAGGARISRGQMAIDFNGLNALSGVASFSGYDAHGHRMTWVGMLYQFHQTAKDGMVIDILAPATSQLFGRMYLHRLKGGNLVGQIALPATRYAITWRKNI